MINNIKIGNFAMKDLWSRKIKYSGCGNCNCIISFGDIKCWACNEEIDWSNYDIGKDENMSTM